MIAMIVQVFRLRATLENGNRARQEEGEAISFTMFYSLLHHEA